MALLTGCGSSNDSVLLYRLPYEDGTEVCVGRDHLTHTPDQNRFDLAGIDGSVPYRVVAAQTGVVRIIRDDLSQNCCNASCGNNYVWIEHLGGEWSKYSHLAANSVSGDAGLAVGDVVIAGTFLGFESDVGRACSRCGSTDHLHFEVAVPTDPANPIQNPDVPNNGGFIVGTNRRARFCGVLSHTLVQDRDETAARCGLLLSCLQSQESPSAEGNCQAGLGGDVCVQEMDFGPTVYTRGVDFSSSSLKIDLGWCPGATCDPGSNAGRAVLLSVTDNEGEITEIVANCQNRRILETFVNVEEIRIQDVQGFEGNVECNGNEFQNAFSRWEVCEVSPQLTEGRGG